MFKCYAHYWKHSLNFKCQPHQDLIHTDLLFLPSFLFLFLLSLSFLPFNFYIFFPSSSFKKYILKTCAVLTFCWKIIPWDELLLYFTVRSLLTSHRINMCWLARLELAFISGISSFQGKGFEALYQSNTELSFFLSQDTNETVFFSGTRLVFKFTSGSSYNSILLAYSSGHINRLF